MEKVRVTLNICGNDYNITTDEDPKYVEGLGERLNEDLSKIIKDNSRLSITQAAILAALDYLDEASKADSTADNLRGQIKEYLEDSARYKMEAEVAKREVERLQRELKGKDGKKPF
ncbi:MAG: cell division protein ZapA [Acutalibacteraceae bacterium]|nr:cell division protein ZapA [Acutalibacteraceae bacterium]